MTAHQIHCDTRLTVSCTPARTQSRTRIFLRRTHFAAHVAYGYLQRRLLSDWLRTPAPLIPNMRAVLLSRMLFAWMVCSPRDDYAAQLAVLVSGIRKCTGGGASQLSAS